MAVGCKNTKISNGTTVMIDCHSHPRVCATAKNISLNWRATLKLSSRDQAFASFSAYHLGNLWNRVAIASKDINQTDELQVHFCSCCCLRGRKTSNGLWIINAGQPKGCARYSGTGRELV